MLACFAARKPHRPAPSALLNGAPALDLARAPHALALSAHEPITGGVPAGWLPSALHERTGAALEFGCDLEAAAAAFGRLLALQQARHGPDHLVVASSLLQQAHVQTKQGRLDEARRTYDRAVAIFERCHGADHPTTSVAVRNLGSVLRKQNKLKEAMAAYQRALVAFEANSGPDSLEVATTLSGVGDILRKQDKQEEAMAAYTRALTIKEARLGSEHIELAITVANVSVAAPSDERARGGARDDLVPRPADVCRVCSLCGRWATYTANWAGSRRRWRRTNAR